MTLTRRPAAVALAAAWLAVVLTGSIVAARLSAVVEHDRDCALVAQSAGAVVCLERR